MTVRDFLRITSTLLGGGTNGYSIIDLAPLAATINSAFDGGVLSTFAQDHLVNGACPR